MPYRCIKPLCDSMNCCMCNCAVPEEFEALLYCHHCGRVLNQPDDASSREAEPQVCARCSKDVA
jgi:hypothetical protein